MSVLSPLSLHSVGSFDSQICRGKDWKNVLREWLNLLQTMKNSRSFYRSQLLKEVLVNRFVEFFSFSILVFCLLFSHLPLRFCF